MRKKTAKRGKRKDRKVRDGSRASYEWMDLNALTQYAALSERTLRTFIHSQSDALPAVRIKGKLLVRKSTFDNWLQAHNAKPTIR